MCEKMEELVIEPRPMDTTGGWEEMVNSKAKSLDMRMEAEQRYRSAEQERRNIERRAHRILNTVAFALALIIAGGIYLNYVDGFPVWIAASVAVGGIALFFFVIGWMFGRRSR